MKERTREAIMSTIVGEKSAAQTIAIDGPVASGKSSVGRLLAQALGYRFLDTGVMYRAVTRLALKEGVPLDDEEGLAKLARESPLTLDVDPAPSPKGWAIRAGGVLMSDEIFSPEVERGVSLVARHPGVREILVAQQRVIAARGGIVMVGRDIGTVVLPKADLKVFLRASPEVRARRRQQELQEKGKNVGLDEVLSDISQRDTLDTQRAASPLRPAPDAAIVDTDELDLGQVVQRILDLARSS